MLGIKHQMGKFQIENAISAFENVDGQLAEGISNLSDTVKSHQEKIKESQDHITECNGHIERASRIRERIHQIIA